MSIRIFNRGVIDRTAFALAKSALRSELVNDPGFVLLSVDDAVIYGGIAIMDAYHLNATDAALLVQFQTYIQTFDTNSGLTFVLIATDERFVRTAHAERLQAINRETMSAADVAAILKEAQIGWQMPANYGCKIYLL